MRNIILTVIMLIATIPTMSQEHISFKGIPIQGNVKEFRKKLEEKDFTFLGEEDRLSLYSGKFTGQDVAIGVMTTDDKKNVYSVIVFFEPSGEWKNLVNTYNHYKELYTHKYGDPIVEEENNPSTSDSNISLMYEVNEGTISYHSVWEVTGGDITLTIEKSGIYEGVVLIRYQDNQNYEMKRQSDLDEI